MNARILLAFNAFFYTFFMIYFAERTSSEFQPIVLYLALGISFTYLGVIFYFPLVRELRLLPPFLPAIFFIIGAIITVLPTIVNPKHFSKVILNCTFLLLGNLAFLIVCLYMILTFQFFDLLPIIVIFLVFIIYPISAIITIKKKTQETSQETRTKDMDIVRAIARPHEITEEEVSISKEKKICLVCKGKLLGFNIFLCSNCETFYCEKCARALSDLENPRPTKPRR